MLIQKLLTSLPMLNKIQNIRHLAIISCILVLLPYAFFIHPFEVPDENAHYSSLNFLYNQGRMPTPKDKDNLSLEEMEVEKIFGIVEGKNEYSYHPDFRIEQIEGPIGKYEEDIRGLNTLENRSTYTTHQAALYPPLYYWLTLPFYSLVSDSDILTRLFVSRLSSVILTVMTIVVAYFIGLQTFQKKLYALTLALMTLFYPMTSYIGVGVNSDNLHNLLFGVATLLAMRLISAGWSTTLSMSIGVIIGLDLITKPQAYILVPIFALAVMIRFRFDEWRLWLKNLPYLIIPILLLAGWQEIPKFLTGNPYAAQKITLTGLDNFYLFATGYVRTHLAEMPVWYWGVFKWFGVILPRPLWWIGTRLLGLSGIGILIQIYRAIRARSISAEVRFILLAIGSNLIYMAALFWFDWQFFQQEGRSLGLQARYYMPLLISQMGLLLMGLTSLSWNEVSRDWIRKGIIIFFVTLQLSSLYTQLSSYYDFTTLPIFIDQLSQYKPFFAKSIWWYLWFPLYFAGIITTTIIALKNDKS